MLKKAKIIRLDADSKLGFELYVVDDSPINSGDWFLCNNKVEQCKSNSMGLIKSCNNNGRNPLELLDINACRKIIATTDESLTKRVIEETNVTDYPLTPISQQDIETIVKLYNNGGNWEDVTVDGALYHIDGREVKTPMMKIEMTPTTKIRENPTEWKPKLSPECNVVLSFEETQLKRNSDWYKATEKELMFGKEKMYSREEVEALIQRYRIHAWDNGSTIGEMNKWIKENL